MKIISTDKSNVLIRASKTSSIRKIRVEIDSLLHKKSTIL